MKHGDAQILALDLGTSGAKVAVFDAGGRVLATAFRPTLLRLLPGGGAEQDPAEWWEALVGASQECLQSSAVERSRIEIGRAHV